MSAHTEQRKLTASIPPGGTDRVGCSALSRWVLRHSAAPRFENFWL